MTDRNNVTDVTPLFGLIIAETAWTIEGDPETAWAWGDVLDQPPHEWPAIRIQAYEVAPVLHTGWRSVMA